MNKKDYIISFLLAVAGFISRVPFLEKYQSNWDGPQYTIAIARYSYAQLTPTPPGYPLYIALGKFFHLFIPDLHTALLAVSVFASMFGAVVLYIVGQKIANRFVGIAAAVIFLTGSTFYYFGLTPYGYVLLPGMEVLLGYSVYRIFINKKYEGYLLGAIIGILFGIRPQELLQIFPLVLLGLYFLPKNEKIKALCLWFIITLLWLVPILYITGLQSFIVLWYNDLLISVTNNAFSARVALIIKGFLLSFGLSAGFLLYYVWLYFKKRKIINKSKKIITFYLVWILPGFLYNLLLRTEHAGYQMSYLSAFLLIIPYAIWASTKKRTLVYGIAVGLLAIFNLYWFFYNRDPNYTKPYRPTSFHYSDIRKNDLKVGSKVTFIQQKFNPKSTYIIATEVLWRPYSYYLKTYHVTTLTALDNTQIPYIYQRYDTIDWNLLYRSLDDKNFVIPVPKGITTIIFPDDQAYTWIKGYPFKTDHLPGNSIITVLSVKPNDKILYNYHSIKIEK